MPPCPSRPVSTGHYATIVMAKCSARGYCILTSAYDSRVRAADALCIFHNASAEGCGELARFAFGLGRLLLSYRLRFSKASVRSSRPWPLFWYHFRPDHQTGNGRNPCSKPAKPGSAGLAAPPANSPDAKSDFFGRILVKTLPRQLLVS